LIAKLAIDRQNDILVFIGDYIDRGIFPRKVVDYVLRLRSEVKNVVCLLGNHEQMFLRYLDGLDEKMYLSNGGATTLSSYEITGSTLPSARKAKIPPDHLFFFQSLLPYFETTDYIFVHAGLVPGLPLAEQDIHDLLWIRQDFIYSNYDFGKKVVFGHTHLRLPLIEPNKIGIDTGVVFGGNLTCVELPAVKIHQV
jgi:serine/threonine protein phosphatase 1